MDMVFSTARACPIAMTNVIAIQIDRNIMYRRLPEVASDCKLSSVRFELQSLLCALGAGVRLVQVGFLAQSVLGHPSGGRVDV